jgi:PKHD-type hydroxylase
MKYRNYIIRHLLTPKQCQRIIDTIADEEYEFSESEPVNGLGRRASHVDLASDDQWEWLYDKCDKMFDWAESAWGFALDGWHQPLRVGSYQPGDHHDWHLDYVAGDASKVAFSVPLNSEFTGGEVRLMEEQPFDLPVGKAALFPAYHGHCITPVESGRRYALLGWLTGPPFV